MKKKSKTALVKEYLLAGNAITQWKAIMLFKATRLSAIIYNLKHREGLNIQSITETDNDGIHYSKYFIEECINVNDAT